MANESVFLTGDEATSLQEAVESLVSAGIQVQDSELLLPSGNGDLASDPEAEITPSPEDIIAKPSNEFPPSG